MFEKIKMAYHLIKVVRKPETEIQSVIYLSNTISQWQSSKASIDKLYKESDELSEMYNTSYGLEKVTLKDYLKYAPGTLGAAFYTFYAGKGLDVYPGQTTDGDTKEDYVLERIRKSHDFIHLVTGFDTDEEGEAMVNAFVFNQVRLPFSLLIVFGVIMRTLAFKPKRFYPLLQQIIDTWKLSINSQNLLTFKWEEMLDKPFGHVVQEFKQSGQLKEFITSKNPRPPLLQLQMHKYGSSIFENQMLRPPLLM